VRPQGKEKKAERMGIEPTVLSRGLAFSKRAPGTNAGRPLCRAKERSRRDFNPQQRVRLHTVFKTGPIAFRSRPRGRRSGEGGN
jgi:hypothetical protein